MKRPPVRPTTRRQERGREDILAAAAKFVAEHGYHGMSMRDLARATGQSLANLYNYFSSKGDLLYALQSRAFESLLATAGESISAAEGAEGRFYAFILNHVRYVASQPEVMRVLVHEAGALPSERRHAIRAQKERYFRVGRDLVRALIHDASPPVRRGDDAGLEQATYSIFGMLNWVYAWYEPSRHGDPPAAARTIHEIALGGLVGRRASRRLQLAVERRAHGVALPSALMIHGDVVPA